MACYCFGAHRYGFNGMEKDDEFKGNGNSNNFGARIHDSRLGRWLAVDPKGGSYPFSSPYSYVTNSPILLYDPNGKDNWIQTQNGEKLV